jgi:hypothetical protein
VNVTWHVAEGDPERVQVLDEKFPVPVAVHDTLPVGM